MVWASKAYPENGEGLQWFTEGPRGGAKRSRTADLLNAIQALYQLSYSPEKSGFLRPVARRRGRDFYAVIPRRSRPRDGIFCGASPEPKSSGRRCRLRP